LAVQDLVGEGDLAALDEADLAAAPGQADVPRPQSTSWPLPVSVGRALHGDDLVAVAADREALLGTGAHRHRRADRDAGRGQLDLVVRCEKLAATLAESTAATETTEAYDAG
jgi:hypothetical protein